MLSKIVAKNFMSWKTLEFTVKSGIVLIDGWNEDDQRSEGSGKSAILNSISWGIFGKIPKDANVDEVIKDGETTCSVALIFDNGESIVRSRKPNDLYILKPTGQIKGKSAHETQTFIEEYVGCNFETFCQSVYFAQNYDKKFLSSNQENKGKILSSIQNLQIFDKARKEVMDLLKLEEPRVTSLKARIQVEENNISNYTSQKALITSFISDKIDKHRQQVSMVIQQRDLISGHIKRFENDLQGLDRLVLEIDLDVISRDETDLNQAKTEYNTQLSDLNYQYSQIDSVKKTSLLKEREGVLLAGQYSTLQTKQKQRTNITSNHTYLALLANIKTESEFNLTPSYLRLLKKKSELETYISNPTKICPSCGSDLKNVDISKTQIELDSIINEMNTLAIQSSDSIESLNSQLLAFEVQFKDDADKIESEMANVLSQLQVVSDYLDQNKIPSADDILVKSAEVKSVLKQIDQALFETTQKRMKRSSLETQRSLLESQRTNYVQQYGQLELSLSQLGEPDVSNDYAKLGVLENQLNETITKLGEIKNLLNVSIEHTRKLETLKDGFKEIKSYVFTNALNELNFRTNQYLTQLFDVGATIKFTNEDQKIESKIVLDGVTRGLGLLSGGQNRRFNLAVDLALSDIVSYRKTSKLDLIIFDEYLKDLSEISMEKSLELLKTRKCPVILIEHNSMVKNIVDNNFFVRLENGTSYESRQ